VKSKNKSIKKKLLSQKKLIATVIFVITALGLLGIGWVEYKTWQASRAQTFSRAENSDVKGTFSCGDDTEIFRMFSGQRGWFLLGEEHKDAQDLQLELEINKNLQNLSTFFDKFDIGYKIAGSKGHTAFGDFVRQSADDTNSGIDDTDSAVYIASIDTSQLPPDEYLVYAKVDYGCGETYSKPYKFFVSYPIYITWTIDWEGSDIPQQNLNDMDSITAKHRDFPLTHFFNPRIYAYEEISKQRRDYLTQWVKSRRDKYGHAIGLHLHMFPDMVEAAGVEPQSQPRWGWHRDDGYDILVSGYSYEKMDKILEWSRQKFVENGLGEPYMFRAGGWFADEGTLRVLEDNEFVLDSSGRDKYSLGTNNVATHWNLSTTTQPYRPNIYDQNSAEAPNMNIWEFPNNGGNAYTLSADELYGAFEDNYKGAPLSEKKVVTYLSHPDWFQEDKPKMDETLTKIEQNMYEDDNGPVIYTTLENVYNIWK
jgi:hypothetical protein